MTERWYLAKVFYTMPVGAGEQDPRGDEIVSRCLMPLVTQLRRDGLIRWAVFMRFSEGGYHLRLRLRGDEALLAQVVAPQLERALLAYWAQCPDEGRPMILAPLALKLNEKWATTPNRPELHQAGTTEMGLMYNTGEEEVFESEEAFEAHYALQDCSCELIMGLLQDGMPLAVRKTLVRLLMDDFFRILDLSDRERFYVLQFCQQQWITYFNIDEETLRPYHALYQRRAARFNTFFARQQSVDERLTLLPNRYWDHYREWLALLKRGAPPLIARDDVGNLTSHSALRLLTFFHLTHNRIGIGLLQEIYGAYILANYYRTRISRRVAEDADYWVQENMKQFGGQAA
ncbi:MAG: hypothetical protein KDD73_03260 [Anaerolineales bacterium]|nr:hypothetical protein [Anaerolineales bacterium]